MSGFDPKDAPEEDQLLNCMRCGMCLPTCPTYQLTGRERSSPRGRIALMRSIHDGELTLSSEAFQQEMDYCLGCLACVSACPAGVRYDRLLEASRDQVARHEAPQLAWWQRTIKDGAFSFFSKIERLKVLARLLYLYQRTGLAKLVVRSGLLEVLPLPWNLGKLHGLLPTLPAKFSSQTIALKLEPHGEVRLRVGLPLGCVMDVMLAKENEATARVLQRVGCQVITPPHQGCCGALHAHAGRLDGARELARQTIDRFGAESIDVICSNSAGCGNCMKSYDHLLKDDVEYKDKARAFVAKVKDIHEVLVDLDVSLPLHPQMKSLTYHDACHLAHGQGIRAQPRRVCCGLTQDFHELPDAQRCCGSAGVYNLTHFETSMQLLKDKIDNILSTDCEVVAVANPGCLMQIRYGLSERKSKVRAEHPIVLLDEAYTLLDSSG